MNSKYKKTSKSELRINIKEYINQTLKLENLYN